MNHIPKPLKNANNNAPNIPSIVFLGDKVKAKGRFPNKLPKIKPPLSAYQQRQANTTNILGLH
jgi:hypothetical protein